MLSKVRYLEPELTKRIEVESPPQTPAYHIPGVKPVFPWEMRAQPPTRVFVEDAVPSDRTRSMDSEGTRSDDDDESTASFEELDDDGVSDNESGTETMNWRDYGVNQWDVIPGISQYVSALQRNNPKLSPEISSTQQNPLDYDDERPALPLTTKPAIRRNQWGSTQNQWGSTQKQRAHTQKQWGPSAPGIPPPDKWVCGLYHDWQCMADTNE